MSAHTIFGTDGIRGRAGEGWLAEDKVRLLGWALGEVLGEGRPSAGEPAPVLLGHDGRRSGPDLVRALAEGLSGSGFRASSAGLTTTPGLAWLTRTGDFHLGAMVSASHNPAEDNGIKVFSSAGEKLSDELQERIEALLHNPPAEFPTGEGPVAATALEEDYLNHLLRHADGLNLSGVMIALDCANGGGSRVAPRVFGRLGAQVCALAAEPDGDNINDECGSTHPEGLIKEVQARGARMGIALDGDGDRCILVDERGELVHGDGIMTVLARHAADHGDYSDPRIVATVMSNRGLHRALREVGVGVVEVGVGDRQVVEGLRRENLKLGGEQSGHIILGDENHYIGDGILTALHVLRVMQSEGASLSHLAAPYQPMPQVLLNVPVAQKPSFEGLPEILALVQQIEEQLGDDGRVLLRYSGTEPLARVMVEGTDPDFIQARARDLAQQIEREIGAPS